MRYKMGAYHLAALRFGEAASAFAASQGVYKAGGRRTNGPSMAMMAVQGYLIVSDAAGAERMLAEISAYRMRPSQ